MKAMLSQLLGLSQHVHVPGRCCCSARQAANSSASTSMMAGLLLLLLPGGMSTHADVTRFVLDDMRSVFCVQQHATQWVTTMHVTIRQLL